MPSSSNSSSNAAAAWAWTVGATLAVVVLGCSALYYATLGWRVVSTEQGRRLDIAQRPRALPPATLDLPARPQLHDVLASDGRVTIVAFMYARCNAVCRVLGSELQQLQNQIATLGLQDQVRLMSISFDPEDSAAQLDAYARRQHADPLIWQIYGIAMPAERQALLDTFGIVVLPAPLGEFLHNAALHLVDAQGRLVKIDDFDQPEQALADAVSLYQRGLP